MLIWRLVIREGSIYAQISAGSTPQVSSLPDVHLLPPVQILRVVPEASTASRRLNLKVL